MTVKTGNTAGGIVGNGPTAAQPPKVRQDPKAWETGYNAGLEGKAMRPPAGIDGLAFYSGLIEGEADRKLGRRDHKPTKPQP